MRSDLKAVAGISSIETDLDEKTCSFNVEETIDVSKLLDDLADKNNKISDWAFAD